MGGIASGASAKLLCQPKAAWEAVPLPHPSESVDWLYMDLLFHYDVPCVDMDVRNYEKGLFQNSF